MAKVGRHVTTIAGVTQGQLISAAIFGTYQAMTWAQFGGVSPDLNHPWFSMRPPKGGTWLNFAQNQDPKIESLMLAAMAAKSFNGAEERAGPRSTSGSSRTCRTCGLDRVVLGVAAHSNVQAWETFTDDVGPRACCSRTRPCCSSRRPGSPSHASTSRPSRRRPSGRRRAA